MKFVIFTNPELDSGREVLQTCYEIYVEYVIKNAMIPFDGPIENELFVSALLKHIRTL